MSFKAMGQVWRMGAASVVAGVMLAAPGCVRVPPPLDVSADPRLPRVVEAFEATITEMKTQSPHTWYSGWSGNFWVQTLGGNNRGLCYQWQTEVYLRVTPRIRDLHLDTIGIALDKGKPTEHHAVLVYDPARIPDPYVIPAMTPPRPGWILDGWSRGKPDIYLVEDWIRTFEPKGKLEIENIRGDDGVEIRVER